MFTTHTVMPVHACDGRHSVQGVDDTKQMEEETEGATGLLTFSWVHLLHVHELLAHNAALATDSGLLLQTE